MDPVNTKGRVIHKGPKGGFYVLGSGGKKIYKFTRAVPPAPAPAPSPPRANVNTKGRAIYQGPKGGFYVLGSGGKKIYKFTRAAAAAAPVPTPRRRIVPSPVKEKLLKLLQNVRKRKKGLTKKAPFKLKLVPRIFTRWNLLRMHDRKEIEIYVPVGLNNEGSIMALRENYLPTQKWLDAQSKYIMGLNDYDFYTAMAYTVRSHEWIGPWLRGTKKYTFSMPSGFVLPLKPQIEKITGKEISTLRGVHKDVVEKAMNMYAKDLYRIIRGAPPLPQPMYVFRGLSRNIFQGKIGTKHVLKEFASTGYVPQAVYAYSGGYLRIKLLKGSRVLLLQGLNRWNENGEFEIVLNKNSLYKITKRNLPRGVINRPNGYVRKNYVTDVTVFS